MNDEDHDLFLFKIVVAAFCIGMIGSAILYGIIEAVK